MVMVSSGLPLEYVIMVVYHHWPVVKVACPKSSVSEGMDLIGRPSQTMPNGVIVGYLYKCKTPLLPASS